MRLRNSHRGRSRRAVTLSGENLVVERTEVQAERSPRVEVVRSRDRAGRALVLANGPVLVEGSRTLDGRLVHAGALIDIVRRPIGVHGTLVRQTRGGVVGAEVLENVVLNEWARRPAVDREVAVTLRVVAAAEVDSPGRSWVPSLATNEVTIGTGPLDAVRASTTVRVGDLLATIGPERVVITVVGSRGTRGTPALNELRDLSRVEGEGRSAYGSSADGEESTSGGNHDENTSSS